LAGMSEEESVFSLLRRELCSDDKARVDHALEELNNILQDSDCILQNEQIKEKVTDKFISDAVAYVLSFSDNIALDTGLDICWALRIILLLSRDPVWLEFFIQQQIPFAIYNLLAASAKLHLVVNQIVTNIVVEWACYSKELLVAMDNTLMLEALESILWEFDDQDILNNIAGALFQLTSRESFCLIVPLSSLLCYASKAVASFNHGMLDGDGHSYSASLTLLVAIHDILLISTSHRLMMLDSVEALKAIAFFATVAEGFVNVPINETDIEIVKKCQQTGVNIMNLLLGSSKGYCAGDEYDLCSVDVFSDSYV
jgi:hypothetical protein